MSDDIRRRLLSQRSPSTKGIWRIKGEDPNADLSGPHVRPNLGLVEGTYEEAVEYALTLKGFFSWGRGGSVEPAKIPKVKKIDKESIKQEKIKALEKERSALLTKLTEVRLKLDELTGKTYEPGPIKNLDEPQ
jgi:hypothetical protein